MTNYEKLQKLIEETEHLIQHGVLPSAPAFQVWYTNAERTLIQIFGEESFEHKKLKGTHFRPVMYTSTAEVNAKCKEGLLASKLIFESYLSELSDASYDVDETEIPDMQKVFIVHGHDGELKQAVARLVEKQDLTAIILNEQANQGRTIIEKFVAHSDVGGAICLFTADDLGRAKADKDDSYRARQNVVFETGYFFGKLGRDKVVVIAERGVELPSDMQGIVYTDRQNWEIDVLRELKSMGYLIDFNRLF